MGLSEAARLLLLKEARGAIASRLGATPRGNDVTPEPEVALEVTERRGAFVTVRVAGELRGCIGYIEAERPLLRTIRDAAVAAALHDDRFDSIRADELPELRIDLSVLSAPVPAGRPEDVQVGRHGIILSQGSRRGLLLPQVATEHGWDRETFLAHGCLKAGLPIDAWRRGARIDVFEAEVFGE